MNVPSSTSDALAPVRAQLASGQWAAAEATCRAVLAAKPRDARALGLLAHVLHRAGRWQDALDSAEAALAIDPSLLPALMEKAAIARKLSQWPVALQALQALVALQPRSGALHCDLGTVRVALGDHAGARAAFEHALMLDPRILEAEYGIGQCDAAEGAHEAALARFTRCTTARPPWIEAWLRTAETLMALGRHGEAVIAAQQALALRPDDALSLKTYARALLAAKYDYAEWIWAKRRIAAVEPTGRNQVDLALALWEGFFYREGAQVLDAAIVSEPDYLPARWARFQYPLEVFPHDEAFARTYLDTWRRGFADAEARIRERRSPPSDQIDCLRLATNFYLHYLGEPFVEEQRRYGTLRCDVMDAAEPGLSERHGRRQMRRAGGSSASKTEGASKQPALELRAGNASKTEGASKRRIGFVSGYFRSHTVMKLFGPLIAALDRDLFEIQVFMLEQTTDARTEWLRERVDLLVVDRLDAERWVKHLDPAELDVLVYLDVGMHPIAQVLSGLRFAPVQCAMWGHPVTTGCRTIDYFLSSELMEPEGAQAHYTERLLCLPNLATVYAPPAVAPVVPPSFVRRGEADALDYYFGQTVYKITPLHDAIFIAIAKQLPGVRFHMLPHPHLHIRLELEERMRPKFEAAGLDFFRHVVMHPQLPLPQFLGLAAACEVNLDSIGWSGGNTTLEILWHDVPTITLPGTLMRARHTCAILERLELDELIARDIDDYVRIAVDLGRDRSRRERLRATIAERKHRLYNDTEVVTAMNAFLRDVEPPVPR